MRFDHLFNRVFRRASAGSLALLCLFLALPSTALADEWFERTQAELGLIPGNESAERVLFPALIAMDPFPIGTGDRRFADPAGYLYLPRGDAQRNRVIEWARGRAQQDALEAVRTVADVDANYMFSIQIGSERVPSEWVEAGLYIEQGHDQIIALTEFTYLGALSDRLFALAYANGIAKAESGNGDEALEDYARLLTLQRTLLERPTQTEKDAAIVAIEMTCSLMADLVYQYTRPGDNAFSPMGIADAVLETDDAVQRYRFRDFTLPVVSQYEARQMFDRAAGGGARIEPDRFAMMMAAGTGLEGLSSFGSLAMYRDIAQMHADRIDFEKRFNDMFADFQRRWNYSDLFDDMLRQTPVAQSLDPSRFAILTDSIAGEIESLFPKRKRMLTALSGMRSSLGAVAFYLDNGSLPGRIVSIQPKYLRSLRGNYDYMGYSRRNQQNEPLQYWVPIRDERFGPRETPAPYAIRVVFTEDGTSFASASVPPASRARDLPAAIPFAGFGVDADELAAGTPGDFNAGDFGSAIGFDAASFSTAQSQRIARDLVVSGMVPRFGLSNEEHAAFEAYLTGQADSFDFSALRRLAKRMIAEEAPSEMDAQQASVALAGLRAQGISLDQAGQTVRQQLRQLVEMASSGLGGMDPQELSGPGAMLLAGGDLDETVTSITGQTPAQLIEYIGGLVDRIAAVPSLREAVEKANRGEFMTSAELVSISNDVTDALVTAEVMNPLRDMLVHFRSSQIGELLAAMPEDDGGATDVVFAIDDSSFLLYSVGFDNSDDRAALCDNGTAGDRLYWPPGISLFREYRNR